MVHLKPPGSFATALLTVEIPPICFRVVSWIPKNGFVGRTGNGRDVAAAAPRPCGPQRVRRKLPAGAIKRSGGKKKMTITRRGLLGAASAAWATTVVSRSASAAAEFEFKLGV